MSILCSSQVGNKIEDYAYAKKGDINNHTYETHVYEFFFTLFSKTLHRVLHTSNALALMYAFLKIVLENDGISGRILILSSSLLIFLATLVNWLWLFTTVLRRLYSMKTLRIASFPLSKFHILLYRTNNFLPANQLRPVREALSFQTQSLLSNSPSAIHNLGLNEIFRAIFSISCRTKMLQKTIVDYLLEVFSHLSLQICNLSLNKPLHTRTKINTISLVISSALEMTQKYLLT